MSFIKRYGKLYKNIIKGIIIRKNLFLNFDKINPTNGDDKTKIGNSNLLPYGCHLSKAEKRIKPASKDIK